MKEVDAINDTFDFGERLKVEKLLPCNCRECESSNEKYFYKYSDIQRARDRKKKTIECRKSFLDVPIPSLLADVFNQKRYEKKELRDLLMNEGVKEFCETLDKVDLDGDLRKILDQQQLRYRNLEREFDAGKLSSSEKRLELNKINDALLDLINDVVGK